MRRRRASVIVFTAVVVAAAALAPVEALPVRAFGAPVSVGAAGADSFGPSMALLPDGTVGVAWTSSLTTIHLAIRRPGASVFTEATPLVLAPGRSVVAPLSPVQWPAVNLEAAGSEFLLGWGESGAGDFEARVVRVSARATSIPLSTSISGSDLLSVKPIFGTASDGSAAAMWGVDGPGGSTVWHVARRAGTTGAWQRIASPGSTFTPYSQAVAIDTSRSVTAAWTSLAGPLQDVKVRSYQGGGWGVTMVPSTASAVGLTTQHFMTARSAGASTLVAVVDNVPGTSLFSADPQARAVRVLSRVSSGASWSLSGPLLGPGRYAASPILVTNPNGSAAISFFDVTDGTDPSVNVTLTRMVSTRSSATRTFSAPVLAGTVSVTTTSSTNMLSGSLPPALAPDGTVVVPTPATFDSGGGGVALGAGSTWRAGWTGQFVEQEPIAGAKLFQVPVIGMVIDQSGRATFVYVDSGILTVKVSTTALPKPFARSRAALSTSSPRVGVALSCKSTWTGAATLTYSWLRSGSAISGATAQTYTPRAADRGRLLSCRVRAANTTGPTLSTSIARTVS